MSVNSKENWWVWLKKFFANYFWLGLVFILFSIMLDLYFPSSNREYIVSISIKLIEAIGISVLIASIFTFASGTSDFVDKIQGLLEGIVVKRNFLANIDPDGKKEALKSLIQPSISEKNKYPNIGDYYGFFINKTLEIGKKSVRSNYQITSRVYFDRDKNKIAVEGTYSYRLYPSSEGFNDITVGFEDQKSNCAYVTVSDPMGEQKRHDNPNLAEHNEGGDISYRASISTKDFGDRKNHLDVELRVTEYGSDHWKLIQFKALQPTDGFKFQLRCDDNIIVQEHAIFVVGAKYYLLLSNDRKNISVSCNQWVNEGTGVCVLVSIPHSAVNEKNLVVPVASED
jgi:hypothetical protein